jgi:hypothetical protein
MNCILQGNCTLCPTVLGYRLCMVPKGGPLYTSLLLFQKIQTSKMPVFRTKTYPSKLYLLHMFQLGYSASWHKIKSWYTVLLSGSWQCNKHNAQSISTQNNAVTPRQILLGMPRSHLNASSAACHVFTLFSLIVFLLLCVTIMVIESYNTIHNDKSTKKHVTSMHGI